MAIDDDSSVKKLTKGPQAGFGKGVNDYLNHFVTVSDAKAAAFLTLDFVIIQFIAKEHFRPVWGMNFHWGALGFLSLSILCAALVIFPRLPHGENGLIFWEDIRQFKNPEKYSMKISEMDIGAIEAQYAHQNFHVGSLLHKKMRWVQWTISLFLIGALFSLLTLLGNK